jgi:peptidoglycan/xylan/chitin deacetylase (PgdA/CDA1 family)
VPILKKYNIPATSFLITSWNDPKNITTNKDLITFMSHSHAMHDGGCEGGHGGLFRCLEHDKAIADLETSRQIINGGDVFCYPFGDYTDQAIQELKEAGFKMAVTTEYGKAEPGMNPLLLPRVRISQTTSLNAFINAIN